MQRLIPLVLVVLAACAPMEEDPNAPLPDGGTNPAANPDGGEPTGPLVLAAEPSSIEFGTVVTLDEVSRDVIVENRSDVTVPVTVELVGAGRHYAIANPPEELRVGEFARIFVVFGPQFAGEHRATLRIAWDAGAIEIPLSGTGLVAETCAPGDLEVSPTPLDLGNVMPSRPLSLTVTVRNRGDTCRLPAPAWLENTANTFKVVQPYPAGTVLHIDGTRSIQVNATAMQDGPLVGRLLVAGEAETGAVFEVRMQ